MRRNKTQKTQKRKKRAGQRKQKTRRSQRKQKGGDYAKKTTSILDGIPVTDNVVVSVEGVGSMDKKAFLQMEEDRDRNGTEIYD